VGSRGKLVLLWAGVGYDADPICSCALVVLHRLCGPVDAAVIASAMKGFP
jgi:hypothetical protein